MEVTAISPDAVNVIVEAIKTNIVNYIAETIFFVAGAVCGVGAGLALIRGVGCD